LKAIGQVFHANPPLSLGDRNDVHLARTEQIHHPILSEFGLFRFALLRKGGARVPRQALPWSCKSSD
jgi:hypothetical protein